MGMVAALGLAYLVRRINGLNARPAFIPQTEMQRMLALEREEANRIQAVLAPNQ